MKQILIFGAALMAAVALAQTPAGTNTVTILWGYPEQEPGITFNLYASTNAITMDNFQDAPIQVSGITAHTCTLTNLADGSWSFALSAERNGIVGISTNSVLNVSLPLPNVQAVQNVKATSR